VACLNALINECLVGAEGKAAVVKLYVLPKIGTPDFSAFIAAETPKWAAVKLSGAKIE
jgi:hypothetical protein